MIGFLLVMLAGAEAEPSAPELPVDKLICRYDTPLSLFTSRRRMCLTAPEWEQREKDAEKTPHTMLRDYLGDTNCLNNGICTSL